MKVYQQGQLVNKKHNSQRESKIECQIKYFWH